MAGAWGPWTSHDGMSVPLPAGTTVFVSRANGTEHAGTVSGTQKSGWIWSFCDDMGMPGAKVVRYRARRPDGLLRLVELLEAVPSDCREHEPA